MDLPGASVVMTSMIELQGLWPFDSRLRTRNPNNVSGVNSSTVTEGLGTNEVSSGNPSSFFQI
jgi:hypothetical protein